MLEYKRILCPTDFSDASLKAFPYAIDLITIATHGFTGWNHLVCGSVAEKVVRMAHVPVLTVCAKMTAEKREEKLAEQSCSH